MTAAPYDVFVSYARADAARARVIRDKLAALGLSVFFDAEGIDSGEEFPDVIDRSVRGAKCVLGLWSHNAFAGRWVRIESRIGLDQNKLVAATIDGLRPEELPAEFYNVNVVSLADYAGQDNHDGWARIVRAVGKRVGREDLAGAPLPARAPAIPPMRPAHYFAIAAALGVLMLVLALSNTSSVGPSAAAAVESPQSLTAVNVGGAWSGAYTEAGRETRFDLQLEQANGGAFSGSVSEPDIYGIAGGQAYRANITGEVRADGSVRFTKTYGAQGAAMRAVVYEGRVAPDGRSIAGTWDTGSLHGPFYMDRN